MKLIIAISFYVSISSVIFSQHIDYEQKICIPENVKDLKNSIDYIANKYSIPISYGNNIPFDTIIPDNKNIISLDSFLNNKLRSIGVDHIRTENKILLTPLKNESTKPHAQTTKRDYIFKGKIINKRTKDPIDCAAIFISELKRGTICDNKGIFSVETLDHSNFKVSFSCLGYQNLNTTIDLNKENDMVYELEESNIKIDEIVVSDYSWKKILELVKKNKFKNYSKIDTSYIAFYKETIWQDEIPLQCAEGFFNINKRSYRSFRPDDIELINGKIHTYTYNPDYVKIFLRGSLNSTIKLDIAKVTPHFLDEELIEKYRFKENGTQLINDRVAYAINFFPEKELRDIGYEGTLFIDTETYGIAGAIFNIQPSKLQFSHHLLVIKEPKWWNITVSNASYKVSYSYDGSKWHLDKCSFVLDIQFKGKKKENDQMLSTFRTASEIKITDIPAIQFANAKKQPLNEKDFIYKKLRRAGERSYGYNPVAEEDIEETLNRYIERYSFIP